MISLIGYVLAGLVGISLGLIGSGGSILTVPIFVYIMGIAPLTATAYSLFVVGITALVGGIQSARCNNVDFKKVLVFGLPSIVAVYLTRSILLPYIPENLGSIGAIVLTKSLCLMLLFAVVMILASISMIRTQKNCPETTNYSSTKIHYSLVVFEGILVGVLTGLVGAGGGFLIIPALVVLAKMPMKLAIGTSLFIIGFKSMIGFLGDLNTSLSIDWGVLFLFTSCAVSGILVGINLNKKVDGSRLKKAFGWFVLLMGIYILLKELLFS